MDKQSKDFRGMSDRFLDWKNEYDKLQSGDITGEEYDAWRYSYPRIEVERTSAKLRATRKKMKEETSE